MDTSWLLLKDEAYFSFKYKTDKQIHKWKKIPKNKAGNHLTILADCSILLGLKMYESVKCALPVNIKSSENKIIH